MTCQAAYASKNATQMRKEGSDPNYSRTASAPKTKIMWCKYFARGTCKFGSLCAYMHYESDYGQPRKLVAAPADVQEATQDQETMAQPVSTQEHIDPDEPFDINKDEDVMP